MIKTVRVMPIKTKINRPVLKILTIKEITESGVIFEECDFSYNHPELFDYSPGTKLAIVFESDTTFFGGLIKLIQKI